MSVPAKVELSSSSGTVDALARLTPNQQVRNRILDFIILKKCNCEYLMSAFSAEILMSNNMWRDQIPYASSGGKLF